MSDCNCREEMEALFAKNVPTEATESSASMGGYLFALPRNGGAMRELPGFLVKVTYHMPKKAGTGTKRVVVQPYALASFCPFCGKPYTHGSKEVTGVIV